MKGVLSYAWTAGVVVVVAGAPLFLLGLARRWWWKNVKLDKRRGSLAWLAWLMDGRVAVAGAFLSQGWPKAAWTWLLYGRTPKRTSRSGKRGPTGNRALVSGELGSDVEGAASGSASDAYSGLVRMLEDVIAGRLGDGTCAPLAMDYLVVAQRMQERANDERGKGLLGISSKIDTLRGVSLGRKLASCLSGMDLTGFGFSDVVDLAEALIEYADASPTGEPTGPGPGDPPETPA